MKTGEELLRALTADPVEGWKTLVQAYSGLVWSIATGMRLSQEDAEEVYQNTWLLLHRYAHSIRDARSLPAWIATTTRREGLLLLRRNQMRRDVESIHGQERPGSAGETPTEVAVESEESTLVATALAELSPRCREIFARLYFSPDEPTYRELADELGMPVGSLGPTRQRCLERLARILEGRGV